MPWLFVDLDVAWNHARFTGDAPEGNFIPGRAGRGGFGRASPSIATARGRARLFLRYIGAYPLIEDNSVRSDASHRVRCAGRLRDLRDTRLRLDVFNLFNAKTQDITYYYASRLPGEPAEGVDDIHFHPGEKRSFRVSLSYRF